MKPKSTTSPAVDLAKQIDAMCDHFEAGWKLGIRPRIEDYLLAVEDARRPRILRELLFVELACRGRIHEQPRADEYSKRFPGHAELVDGVFSAAQARLQWAPIKAGPDNPV